MNRSLQGREQRTPVSGRGTCDTWNIKRVCKKSHLVARMHGTRWEGEMKLERQMDGQSIRQWESYVLMCNSAKTPIAWGGGRKR